jgi:hypothetical protein
MNLKNKLVAALALAVFVVPGVSFALVRAVLYNGASNPLDVGSGVGSGGGGQVASTTNVALQAQLNELLAQVQALQAQLTAQGGVTVTSSSTLPTSPVICPAWGCNGPEPITPPITSTSTNSSITVVWPNGGEVLNDAKSTSSSNFASNLGTIKWTSANLGSLNVGIGLIDVATNDTLKYIATNIPNTGSYVWASDPTIPNGNYKIGIWAETTEGASDNSDGSFQITGSPLGTVANPSLIIESPQAGEGGQVGEPMNVTWQEGGVTPKNVQIFLQNGTSGAMTTLASLGASTTSMWNGIVPSSTPAGSNYTVIVCDEGVPSPIASAKPLCGHVSSLSFAPQLAIVPNPAFAAGYMTAGSANAWIGSYIIYAPNTEALQLKTVSINEGANANNFQNFRVAVNGTQFGATQASPTSAPYGNFSGSVVIPANSSAIVNVLADVLSSAPAGNQNTTAIYAFGTGATTLAPYESSGMTVTGQTMTVAGAVSTTPILSVTKNSGIPSLTVPAGTIGNLIGSYVMQAPASEGALLNSVTLGVAGTNVGVFQNVRLIVNGVQFGATQATLGKSQNSYTFSASPASIPAGTSANIQVVADVLANAPAGVQNTTSIVSCAAAGQTSYSAYQCPSSPVQGQTMTVTTVASSTPTLSVAADASNPQSGSVVMGSIGNNLAAYRFTATSNAENIAISKITINDSASTELGNTAVAPSFSNMRLWLGSTLVGAAAAPVTIVKSGSNATNAYTFNFTAPVSVPAGGSVALTLKGDVNTYSSGGATDASQHQFSIPVSSSSVIAFGQTSNAAAMVNNFGAVGNYQTIYRTLLTVAGQSVTTMPALSLQRLGSMNFTANVAGSATMNSLKLTFGGNASTASAFLNSITLRDPNGNDIVSIDHAAQSSISGNTITWTFSPSSNPLTVTAGSLYTLNVYGDLSKLPVVANVAQTITASIQSNWDFSYLDGTNGNGTLVQLSAEQQAPITVVNLQGQPAIIVPTSTTPAITVTSPNGGQTYHPGDTVPISWSAPGVTTANNSLGLNVYDAVLKTKKIVLSQTVGDAVSNGQVSPNGTYNWTIPSSTPAGNYLVYMSWGNSYDESNAPFTIVVPTAVPPPVTVASDGTLPAAELSLMGDAGDLLGAYNVVNNGKEGVKITDVTIIDTTNASQPSFNGLTLWNSPSVAGVLVGAAAAGTKTSAGYTYVFHLATPIVVSQGTKLDLAIRGNVSSYQSGGAVDGSTHVFGVAALSAIGATTNQGAVVTLPGSKGCTFTVVRAILQINTNALGGAIHSPSTADPLGVVTLFGVRGNLQLNKMTVSFHEGSGVPSAAFLNSVSLVNSSGINLVAAGQATQSINAAASTVTWNFNNYVMPANASVSFTLKVNSMLDSLSQGGSLAASIANVGDITYSDATDGTGVGGLTIGYPFPVGINSVTYAPAAESINVTYPSAGMSLSNGGKSSIATIQWTASNIPSGFGIALLNGAGTSIVKYIGPNAALPSDDTSFVWANDPSLLSGSYQIEVYSSEKGGGATSFSGPFSIVTIGTATTTPITTPAPTVTISASPTTLTSLGQPTTLRWSSANTSSCTASGAWSGTKALSGSQSIVPTITGVTTPNVYTIVCSGIGSMSPHQAGNAVTVTVAPATPTTTQGNISSTQTAVIGSSFQNVFNQLGSWFKSL